MKKTHLPLWQHESYLEKKTALKNRQSEKHKWITHNVRDIKKHDANTVTGTVNQTTDEYASDL